MTFRKFLLVLTISLVILLIGLLGTSYAYYDLTSPKEQKENINENNQDLNIKPEFIVLYTVNDKLELTSSTIKNNFMVKKNDGDFTNKQVTVEINLEDIVIDESLKTTNFHYQLLENNEIITSGTGENITSESLTLKQNTNVDITKDYTYDLIIWYDLNSIDITNIENPFSAKINVKTSVK